MQAREKKLSLIVHFCRYCVQLIFLFFFHNNFVKIEKKNNMYLQENILWVMILILGFQDRICYEKNAIFQEKDTLLMQSAFQNMMSSLI